MTPLTQDIDEPQQRKIRDGHGTTRAQHLSAFWVASIPKLLQEPEIETSFSEFPYRPPRFYRLVMLRVVGVCRCEVLEDPLISRMLPCQLKPPGYGVFGIVRSSVGFCELRLIWTDEWVLVDESEETRCPFVILRARLLHH
jgi:hypothetical protein